MVVYSNKIDPEGRHCQDFSLTYRVIKCPISSKIYGYPKANYDEFRSIMTGAPLVLFFSLFTDWVHVGIKDFIPRKKYQQISNSQLWFTHECAAANSHRNHY